ncbi:hypothetical protein EPN87_02590 [archaeon]|nr:MAG: hypothetical protein EPN87_02590 [archaeon]
MVFQLIFAIILLAIVVFIGLKILGNVATGIAMIALVMIASFVIAGSWPDLQAIPFIGQYIPSLPSSTQAIAIVKNMVYSIDVIGTSRDSNNGLIVMVANTGKLDITGLNVTVDNQTVNVINQVSYPLKSKQTVALQTDWKSNYTSITVSSGKTSVTYP